MLKELFFFICSKVVRYFNYKTKTSAPVSTLFCFRICFFFFLFNLIKCAAVAASVY